MKRQPFDNWEDAFIAICEERLEEEPFYPYDHLWKENLSPERAFLRYLEENPDYAEKFSELNEDSASDEEKAAFAEMARKLEEKRKQKEIEEKMASKMSKFCPECARVIGSKSSCKCGYRRPGKKQSRSDY